MLFTYALSLAIVVLLFRYVQPKDIHVLCTCMRVCVLYMHMCKCTYSASCYFLICHKPIILHKAVYHIVMIVFVHNVHSAYFNCTLCTMLQVLYNNRH